VNNLSSTKNAVKNTVFLTSAEVITKFLAFMLTIYIARYLQEAGFGKYSFAIAFTSFFSVISDLGINNLTIREIARNKDFAGKYIGNFSIAKVLFSFIALILLYIIINLMNYPSDTKVAVYIFGIYVVVSSFGQFLISVFRAYEKMEYETFVRVIEKISLVFLVICVIYFKRGLIEIAFSFLLSSSLSFIIAYIIIIKKFTIPQFKIDRKFLKDSIKEALPFGLTFLFGIIYFKIDTVMLSLMQGDAVVGWYNAAYNIIDGLTAVVATSIANACYPTMSKYYITSKNELKNIFIQSFLILLISGFIISCIVTVYSEQFIHLFYGDKYSNSALSLKILVWAFFVICISNISSTLLYATNKQRIVTIGTGLGALINITLNLILIPRYSLLGAAFATLITELLGFVIYMYYSLRVLDIRRGDYKYILTDIVQRSRIILKKYFGSRVL
jgi:O-antigen/teichoic acid export membrane protein